MAEAPLILAADDDEDIRLLIELCLKRLGYRVLTAENGEEALALAELHAPDLLLLDVTMPVMGGYELCRAIAARQDPAPPVIFLSANTSAADQVRGLNAGAVDYITKPFDIQELNARIAGALRMRDRLAKLAHDASIDHLTGALNRGQLDRRLNETVMRMRRFGGELGCVLIDIDRFKSINDRFGHQTGDAVLQVVTTRLSGGLRAEDALFRYGGEEFCLLLDGTDAAGAATVAVRSLAAIASEPIAGIDVTASAGVAHWAPVLHYPSELLAAADEALYEAKRAGRAQVKSWVAPSETDDGARASA
jgi:diguanylate cyclase (GGDEF)-like protein